MARARERAIGQGMGRLIVAVPGLAANLEQFCARRISPHNGIPFFLPSRL